MEVIREDTVDRDLERLLCTRSAEDTTPDPTVLEPSYAESVRRYRERERRTLDAERYRWHADQAERLRRTLTDLVEHHERQAMKLLEGGTNA